MISEFGTSFVLATIWFIIANLAFGYQIFTFTNDIYSLISGSTLPFVHAQSDKSSGKQLLTCADGSKPNPAGKCRDGSQPSPTSSLVCADGSKPNPAGKCRDASQPTPPVTSSGTPQTGTGGTGSSGTPQTGTGGTSKTPIINKEILRNVGPNLAQGGIQAGPENAPPIMEAKVTIKLTSIDFFSDHDPGAGDGEFFLWTDIETKGYAQPGCATAIPCNLLDLSVAKGLWDVSNYERVNFIDQAEWTYKFDKNALTRIPTGEYKIVVSMHTYGWELDGEPPKGVDLPLSVRGLLSAAVGNDPDPLKEINKTHYLKFPNEYGLEESIFFDRNSDYQLNYKIIVDAPAPIK